ncbi:hypothetical protein SD15574_0375 [Shigella dysenteriae 155-74]|nr:hypothetical protein Sd1012_2295 [Shigella dysenteriae 1012]EGJ02783.1 hypothetical protein SD15574_0375 [Shigella dysenteriae 155-74]
MRKIVDGKNGAKRCRRGKKRVGYRSLLLSLIMFNILKNK